MMRHLFDQYNEPENRMTHALACCLKENPGLLRSFVRWAGASKVPPARRMEIVEQRLPGQAEVSEEDSERRGLPDMWIHDNGNWAMIVENKVQSPVAAGQIRRHRKTALSRGFDDLSVLAISPEVPSQRSLAGATHRTWAELYVWFKRHEKRSEWARRMTSYMEIAEARMISSGYLNKGSLTTFSGINFSADSPYNYREAKRILGLAITELRKNKPLQKLGMDPHGDGRPRITGREGTHVWDFLRLKQARKAGNFTQFPHLTLSIQVTRVLAMVTIPNGIKTQFRRNIVSMGREGFEAIVFDITADLERLFKTEENAKPWVHVCQRHYLTQLSLPIDDAKLEFDPRTAFTLRKRRGKGVPTVKQQPQWLAATYDALAKKRSNLQVGIGAIFPYSCSVLRTKKALEYIAGTWIACEPLLKATLG